MEKRGVFWFLAIVFAVIPLFSTVKPVKAASASYFFSPSSIKLNVGQSATVTLYLRTDQAINASDGTVVLPSAQVSGSSISKSGSIFANWPEEPRVSGSSIRFAGGLPTPGYSGTNGKVISFSIKGNAEGTGLITISGGRILANDASSSNIYSGTSTATVTVTRVVSGASISSSTHPDSGKWYQAKDAALSWSKPSGASTYSYTLSHDGGQPSKTGSGTATTANFTGLADGIWTFSLTTNFSDGKTATSSYTIRIDTAPPAEFAFTTERSSATDPFPTLKFSTTDSPSGIERYEIVINGGEPISTTENSYKLTKQKPGKHSIIVRAIDKAGNVTESKGDVTIEGFPGPVITNYPSIVSIFQKIKLSGTALYGAKVQLYINDKIVDEFVVKDHVSQSQKEKPEFAAVTDDTVVDWTYEMKNGQFPGYKVVYGIQSKSDGAESNQSNQVRILVAPDAISIFGFNIPMLIILITFLFLLLLLVILFTLLYRKFRGARASRKKKLRTLQDIVDGEIIQAGGKVAGMVEANETTTVFEEINRLKENVDRDFNQALGESDNKSDNKK